ncbi:acyl-CoA dehydrogenase family protein [Rhodococcus chondri]|uniref:Acyl-CoA dehydrogenase family protein n=1 Tax=Rhodococcus chondri TaxID=3065941 RepID=A0ABU7JN80_9NOCA|nr:acyl-CoA dehydrogenase family protein [Rhodococcus sp. CC-R104]MEE2031503.1 acyl-CoA dehydrogenase family protein [Rhodococcus sp. CC-R104]
MRFALDSSHEDFASSIDALLTKSDMPAVIRAWNSGDTGPGLKVWQRLAETGVNGLLIAEEHDGLGADAVDLVVAVEQLGRHAVPGPVVETVAVAPALLSAVAPERLAALAEGSLATVAATPHAPFAVDADAADLVLLVDGDTVSLGTAGEARNSVDQSRRLYPVTAAEQLGTVGFEAAFDLGALATAAQLQGLGRTLLDSTVEYAQQRKQFGRAIGSFQAIKHHLAEVAVALEMARPLLHGAALSVRDGSPTASRDVSAAQVACGDAAYLAARVALQVHGAIGYTQEHDLSLWLTKVRALVTAWGTPDVHRARVVASLESGAAS